MESALSSEETIPWYEKLIRWYRHHRDSVIAWSFLTPMVTYFVIMTFVPLIFLVVVSFTEWNIITPPRWAGLQNLRIIFSNYQDWFYLKVIGRTILYAVAILTLNIAGGFFIALVLNQNLHLKGLFRTMWYLPSVFSGAVVALLLRIYLAGSTGVSNMIL
jgi:ABC-type sugar transport system permease subunit